jgi:hypothetical protein
MRLQPSSNTEKDMPTKAAMPVKPAKQPQEKMQSAMAQKLQDLFKR